MKLKELTLLLKTTLESGANKVLQQFGALNPMLTKAAAYRLYGRSDVDRWIEAGLILPEQSAGKKSHQQFNRAKLESIASTSNTGTYLPVAER
jgi:hypothetical protein